jgi:hypothetical protein
MTSEAPTYRAVIGKRGPYGHTFGHDPKMQGLIPPGGELPAHLLLSLDMRDPRLSFLKMSVGPTLRLVHPFYYSQGQTFAYHMGKAGIIFTPASFDGTVCEDDWPTENYPAQFPSMPVDLDAVSIDPDDWNTDKIFISHDQPTLQDETYYHCGSCGGPINLFAVVPSTPLPNLELWGVYGRGVTANFLFCSACMAINTHNSTD